MNKPCCVTVAGFDARMTFKHASGKSSNTLSTFCIECVIILDHQAGAGLVNNIKEARPMSAYLRIPQLGYIGHRDVCNMQAVYKMTPQDKLSIMRIGQAGKYLKMTCSHQKHAEHMKTHAHANRHALRLVTCPVQLNGPICWLEMHA